MSLINKSNLPGESSFSNIRGTNFERTLLKYDLNLNRKITIILRQKDNFTIRGTFKRIDENKTYFDYDNKCRQNGDYR